MKINDCCNKWKDMIKEAWTKAEHAVQGIKLTSESTIHYPDGAGVIELDIKADISAIEKQVDTNTSDITAMKTDIASNSASTSANASAIASEVTARTNADDAIRADMTNKQAKLTAGNNIAISDSNVISAIDTKYTAGSNVTINSNNVISAVDTKYSAGDGISISANNVISATDTGGSDFTAQNNDGNITFWKDGTQEAILKEGTNITITADGTISAAGGSATAVTASEINMADGRTVQVAIDAIEDELGDSEGTSGTIYSRLDAIETEQTTQNANIATNASAIETKQDKLSVNKNIKIINNAISALGVTNIVNNTTSEKIGLSYASTIASGSVVSDEIFTVDILEPGQYIYIDSTTTPPKLNIDLSGKQDKLTDSQLTVINNSSLQKGYYFDGGTANTEKFQLVAHPTDEDSATVTMHPGTNVTFSKNKTDDININVDLSSKADASTVTTLSNAVSKCYDDYSIDRSSGKVTLTMKAADDMTSASQDILTAGDGVTISDTGVISATGGGSGGAEYKNLYANTATDFFSKVYSELKVGDVVSLKLTLVSGSEYLRITGIITTMASTAVYIYGSVVTNYSNANDTWHEILITSDGTVKAYGIDNTSKTLSPTYFNVYATHFN